MHYGEQFRSWGLGQTAKVAQSWMKIVQVPKISNTTILNTEDCENKFCELFEKKNSKQKFQKMLWTNVLPIKHGENFQSPKNVKVPEKQILWTKVLPIKHGEKC